MPRSTIRNTASASAPRPAPGKRPIGSKAPKAPKKNKGASRDGKTTRKWRPGTVALREIKALQKTSALLVQRAPFQRLVRAAMTKFKSDLRFKPSALAAVQEAAEAYMVSTFEGAVVLQLHRNKKTLNWKDLNYCRRIRGELVA